MLGHLLLEDLLQNCLNAFPDPGLYVPFHVMLELVLRGQAPPSSLNPQLTRRYPCEGSTYPGRYVGVTAGVKRARASTKFIFRLCVRPAKGRKGERRRRDSNPRYPG